MQTGWISLARLLLHVEAGVDENLIRLPERMERRWVVREE
jgi:hypothetical protein